MSTVPKQLIASILFGVFLMSLSACHSKPQASVPITSGVNQHTKLPIVQAVPESNVQAKPEWFTCKQDKECVAVAGVCNAENAVNRHFRKPFTQYRNAMNQQLSSSCKAPFNISEVHTHVGCVKTRCTVGPYRG